MPPRIRTSDEPNHSDLVKPEESLRVLTFIHCGPDWESIATSLADIVSPADLLTLKPCLQDVLRTAVLEEYYIDKDYRNVWSHFYTKKFVEYPGKAKRLHFFDVTFDAAVLDPDPTHRPLADRLSELAGELQEGVDAPGTTTGYLGYVVLRPTEYSRLGRMVLDPRKLPAVTGDVAATRFSANIIGEELFVTGFPHQSQDGEAHVCAQTAVWGLFRYLSQRYAYYPERYPHDITLLNADLRFGRRLPGRGLYMDQVAAMFGAFGLGAEMYRAEKMEYQYEGDGWATVGWRSSRDYFDFAVHTYIESGMPPILGIRVNGGGHAVVAIGAHDNKHVFYRDHGCTPSSDFTTQWIVNDDNFAPYRYVQKAGKHLTDGPAYMWGDIDSMVVPFPDKLLLTAVQADIIITDFLNRIGPPAEGQRYIRRLFATSSKNYKTFRRRESDWVSHAIVTHPLPHFLWIAEFYTEAGWEEGRAIAEVALDGSAGQYDDLPYVWLRYPEQLQFNERRLLGTGSAESTYAIDSPTGGFAPFAGNLRRIR